ncbi:hypothetical protein BDA99DRAFT_501546 [Phascolomyces articulosus]|uniref:Uncharacterized protein n=1 Tax=Phascolomyces articulosus TaxID=60185 RepID=A0AAD5KG25_9FUNG|nr:hypothetical protein BDA99DRAFT_501546 [Phascolomyces articulosus]
MLRRIHRAIGGLALLVLVGLIISMTIIPRLHHNNIIIPPSSLSSSTSRVPNHLNDEASFFATTPLLYTSSNERFLSYSRHGDYFEQHESLRMAVRLAYETNRTIVAPPLRLVYNYNTSIHIPWSKLFDFNPLEKTFGIRIIDRPLPPPTSLSMTEEEVQVERQEREEKLPIGFYERIEITHNTRLQQQKTTNGNGSMLQWFQTIIGINKNETTVTTSTSVTRARRIFALKELKEMQSTFVHCSGLGTWMFRKSLDAKDTQAQLNLALTTTMLTRPEGLLPMTQASHAVVQELGGMGQFSGLTIHMDRMVPHGQADEWLFANNNTNSDEQGQTYNVTAAKMLMEQRQKDAMKDAALELFSSMPINQAVSAALPIQASPLRDYLDEQKIRDQQRKQQVLSGTVPAEEMDQQTSLSLDRRRLLDVCKDYRKNVDPRFPVVYMMVQDDSNNKNKVAVDGTNLEVDMEQQSMGQEKDMSILKPILEYFPCVFYKKDMYQWDILDASWAIESQLDLSEHIQIQENNIDSEVQVPSTQVIDFEQLLAPLLDLLISGQGYSFFEVPPSPLTRAVLWQLGGNDK